MSTMRADPEVVRFIISCAARTGSTMLVHLLRSHQQIVCHDEVLEPSRVGTLAGSYWAARIADPELDARLWQLRVDDPAAFLADVVFDPQAHHAVGFKFKTDEAFQQPWHDLLEVIEQDRGISIIRLRRRDLLAEFVSHEMVLRQNAQTLLRVPELRPVLKPISPDPAHVVRYVGDVVHRELLADDAYAGHPQLDVWYEDLYEERTQRRLTEFLGVAPLRLRTPTVKIIGDNRSLLLNLAAVVDALTRAGYPGGRWPTSHDGGPR